MTSNGVEKEEREVGMRRRESSNCHYHLTMAPIWQVRMTTKILRIRIRRPEHVPKGYMPIFFLH
jgi:hypothetical protein